MTNRNSGYRKPPKHSRFKKGTSGNPIGRPKGSLNMATVLERTLSQMVVIVEDGQKKKVSKMEAAVQQLVDKAIGGDMHAFRVLSVLTQVLEESGSRPTSADLAEADQKILQSLFQRFTPAEAGG
jgi:uncharacterized protein DUF5681